MATIEIQIRPRRQFLPYLNRKQRFACLVCHRRAGKTYSCLQDILARALTKHRKGPPMRFGYIAPTRDQAKDIAWGYLKKFVEALPDVKVNEAELSLVLHNGAQIRLYSGDSYDRMRGLYFDGVVVDEPADIDAEAWTAVIRPCLSDYLGWATFIGTPKGKNAFHSRWVEATSNPDEWFSLMLRASESGIIDPEELRSLQAGTPIHLFNQEYECDFSAPIPGAIYGRFIQTAEQQNRIGNWPIDGTAPVHTAWDLGSPRNTVVNYFQALPFGVIRFIDCDSGLDMTLAERVAHMKGKGYNLGNAYLPHDAAQTGRNGLTFEGEARAAGLTNILVIPPCQSVWPGINQAGSMFGQFEFRLPACERFVDALRGYHTLADTSSGIVRNEPAHTWHSHYADSLRTMVEAHMHGVVPKHASGRRTEQARPQMAITGMRRTW